MQGVEFKPGNASTNPFREAREELEQAENLRRQRRFDRAESICTGLIRKYPDYYAAHHTLGLLYADRGDYRRAALNLMQAAMLNPRSWLTLTALAGVYISLDAHEVAAQTLERARSLNPNEPTLLATLGELYTREREYEKARDSFSEALARDSAMEEATVGLAHANSMLGEQSKAAKILEGYLERGRFTLNLLGGIAALPPSEIHRNLLEDLGRVTQQPNETRSEFEKTNSFILLTALDKAGRHNEAWQAAIAANSAINQTQKKQLEADRQRRSFYLRSLQENPLRLKPSAPDDANQPISLFVLGPSRSGKTTMEMLIGGLEGVKRGFESPSLENAISRAFQDAGLPTAYSLEQLPAQFFPQVRKNYADELAMRAAGSKVFTNTHPGHIYTPRVAEVLPNVKFIFVKRDKHDLALRMYFRLYRQGNEYSYDLRAAHEYIEWYYKMIDLIAEKFPTVTRVINYEDVIADPGRALKIAADLCGLPISEKTMPDLGDDRGCSDPYRALMQASLASNAVG